MSRIQRATVSAPSAKARERERLLSRLPPDKRAVVEAAIERAEGMSEEEYARVFSPLPSDYRPILPLGWREAERTRERAVYVNPGMNMSVIVSDGRKPDGKVWRHVSLSHPDRLPSYGEMVLVKELFIGTDRTALQIFPPRDKHVNIHPYVLHLWHCLDGDVTPDMTWGLNTI